MPDDAPRDELSWLDYLPELTALVWVVHCGGFSAAARASHVDKSTLSRRVRALEDRLGVRLLDRTTRTVRPTQAGQQLYASCEPHLAAVGHALSATTRDQQTGGTVRVTTLSALVDCVWAPVIGELRETHPDVRIEVHSSTPFERLVDAGYDLALRTGRLPNTQEVARRLATWRYVLVASPELAERLPASARPGQPGQEWLLFNSIPSANRWTFERADETFTAEVTPALVSDEPLLLRRMAIDGFGILPAVPMLVMEDLRQGRLVRVMPEWRVAHTHGVFTALPHRAHTAPAVRTVIDALERRLKHLEPQWAAVSE